MVVCSVKTHAQGVAVTPSRIFFNAAAGQAITERIRVSNTDSQMLVLSATVRDWYRDSLGNKVYFPAGSLPASNANWIRVDPVQLMLRPHETKEVAVSILVPDSSRGVTNSMLFLTQVNERKPVTGTDKSGKKIAMYIKVEVGIHLYNTVPGLNRKDLEFIAFEDKGANSDSTRRLALTIRNRGEVPTDAMLRCELTHKTSGNSIKIPARAISMLPGATEVIYITIPAREVKGKYQAVAILDYGDGTDLKVAQKEIVYE
ncbi:hypothetical protein [Niabella soli]|uniref:Molecular chaperone n=1 Tax=Niabella soli DSM 19437 TaxID=929713 RepID=W0F8L5_9BACT|nr:hypothetical protein [Niabella soli]AHF17799.1 hypothetical protein NIASO_14455 [Niabella soli DSM 19437]